MSIEPEDRRETIRRLKFITPTVALLDVDTEVRDFSTMPAGVPMPADGLCADQSHRRANCVKPPDIV
jgi:hypothetical protein